MNLSDHFTREELDVENAAARIVANAEFLCLSILEPMRAKVGPLAVHCGYRDPDHNREVGGASDSYHLFAEDRAAADVSPTSGLMQAAFDWLRLESELPFHKVILEHSTNGEPRCIHIQAHADPQRRATVKREAFTGLVSGLSKHYTECECV